MLNDEVASEGKSTAASESYMVVARRYRPQAFSDLIGQQHVASALANAIRADRVGHAYLFTGARGVGKTSAARIFAKALNCTEAKDAHPCNECDTCQAISIGEDIDVLEIDGASNRGIDEIRQLRQNAGIRPSRSRYKIYIIDEVHMLTKEAFNALLKTLEEPPEHVKFIFATTEPNKIPITILSRCQRFDFLGIETQNIAEHLQRIVTAEGVQTSEEVLQTIARRAGGSMRDSQSLLEQLLSLGGNSITLEDVNTLLGTASNQQVLSIIKSLAEKNAAAAILQLDAAVGDGVEISAVLEQLLQIFRDAMVFLVGGKQSDMRYSLQSDFDEIKKIANAYPLQNILATLQIIEQTLSRIRTSRSGRVLAEIALVRIAELEQFVSINDAIAKLRELENSPAIQSNINTTSTSVVQPPPSQNQPIQPSGSTEQASTQPINQEHRQLGSAAASVTTNRADGQPLQGNKPQSPISSHDPNSHHQQSNPQSDRKTIESPAPGPADTNLSSNKAEAQPCSLSPANASQIWSKALEEVGGMLSANGKMASKVVISATNQLAVQFTAKYTFGKQYCEKGEHKAQLEKVLRQITGEPITVQFVIVEDSSTEGSIAKEQQAASSTPANQRQLAAEAASDPFVKRAKELFNVETIQVDFPKPKAKN